ncbi:hypothetical protein [Nocardiopsis composta]|uniref:Uncharacterized protein n=1 Tax=Nocardiopsis composta TaxID=157465 RepID=A0A7W8QM75_9ACTN|nr:hypothetical protein [Nocardiopsis composta]MBB5432363.1 hypothetical protein [Nocardiopsis composta]
MRWVWRAEAGGFKIEYAAVVLLVATLVTAVFAFGLPTDVRVLYAEGICRIMPDSQGCDGEGQGSDQDTGGSGQDGTPGEEDGEGQAEPSPSPSAPSGGGGEDEEGDGSDSPVMEPAGAFDQEAADDYAEAQEELEEAQGKLDGADSDQVYDDLMNLLGDIVGYNDAKACLTEGDLIACLWTIVGLSPFGKGAKLVKNTPKIIKLWNRWRKAKKTKEGLEKAVDTAKGKVDDAIKTCERAAGLSNRYYSAVPASLGVSSDGGLRAAPAVYGGGGGPSGTYALAFVPAGKKNREPATPCELNWDPKSGKTFGHVFSRHGAGTKNTDKLKGRAASTNKPQGQWLDDQKASDLIKKSYNPKGPFAPDDQVFEIPKGMGQVIMPDGSIKEATHFLVVLRKDGTFKTGYPILRE